MPEGTGYIPLPLCGKEQMSYIELSIFNTWSPILPLYRLQHKEFCLNLMAVIPAFAGMTPCGGSVSIKLKFTLEGGHP